MRVLVAVPALNEAEVIGQVLKSLSAAHPIADVVIVDDGSRDATAAIARAAGANVVSHAINLGVGRYEVHTLFEPGTTPGEVLSTMRAGLDFIFGTTRRVIYVIVTKLP